MTNARLTNAPRPNIDYASLSFNPDEPEPLPEAMYQYPILLEVLPILGAHLNRLYLGKKSSTAATPSSVTTRTT